MSRSGDGGTKVALARVQPGGPIQFWLRRNSPGVAVSPRTPRINRSCSSVTSRSDRGRVSRRWIPCSRATT